MTDENTGDTPKKTEAETETGTDAATDANGAAGPTVQPVTINAQYIKDLSFEAPETPAIFNLMGSEEPNISINVDVRAGKLGENTYEVILNIKAGCQVGDKTAFMAELAYAGLFSLNVPEETLKAVLLIECPRLLFPFARNIIADATRDGGFPPLMLNPIDFVALYRDGMANEAKLKEEPPAGNA